MELPRNFKPMVIETTKKLSGNKALEPSNFEVIISPSSGKMAVVCQVILIQNRASLIFASQSQVDPLSDFHQRPKLC